MNEYYRIGNVVYQIANGRHGRLFVAQTQFEAALTVRRLYATKGGQLGDWRPWR